MPDNKKLILKTLDTGNKIVVNTEDKSFMFIQDTGDRALTG